MSFTTVPTFTPGQVVTATDLNTYLRDNEGYLLNRPSQIILRDNNANYTNNVAGSYANIDGTNLAITLNFSGSLAYVWLHPAPLQPWRLTLTLRWTVSALAGRG